MGDEGNKRNFKRSGKSRVNNDKPFSKGRSAARSTDARTKKTKFKGEDRVLKKERPTSKYGKPSSTKNRNIKQKYNKFNKKPKHSTEDEVIDDTVRLNKYIAKAGIASRREADVLIATGLVQVNGETITEMGFKVKPEDEVRYDGERVTPEKKTYVLLNKPKGFITTVKDERDRKTVMQLVAQATPNRIYPVGRLDRQTTGVLLFTNDGHLAKKLTHPSHQIKKIYHVVLNEDLKPEDMDIIKAGIGMREGTAKVDKVSYIPGKSHKEIGIEIHIGWNRVVRRIFERLGYKVEALDRVSFGGLTKKNLKRGDFRHLDRKEVNFLKML